MPALTLYPATVVSGDAFTTAQLASVLGNTAAYATHTGALPVNAGLGGRFYFPMSDIPAGCVVNSIVASVIAKANVASRRNFLSVDIYGSGGNNILKTPNTPMGIVDVTYSATFSGAELASGGWTTDDLRNNGIEWTASFLSTNATSTTTSWQKFWLTVDYTLAAGGPNALFLGENL